MDIRKLKNKCDNCMDELKDLNNNLFVLIPK